MTPNVTCSTSHALAPGITFSLPASSPRRSSWTTCGHRWRSNRWEHALDPCAQHPVEQSLLTFQFAPHLRLSWQTIDFRDVEVVRAPSWTKRSPRVRPPHCTLFTRWGFVPSHCLRRRILLSLCATAEVLIPPKRSPISRTLRPHRFPYLLPPVRIQPELSFPAGSCAPSHDKWPPRSESAVFWPVHQLSPVQNSVNCRDLVNCPFNSIEYLVQFPDLTPGGFILDTSN